MKALLELKVSGSFLAESPRLVPRLGWQLICVSLLEQWCLPVLSNAVRTSRRVMTAVPRPKRRQAMPSFTRCSALFICLSLPLSIRPAVRPFRISIYGLLILLRPSLPGSSTKPSLDCLIFCRVIRDVWHVSVAVRRRTSTHVHHSSSVLLLVLFILRCTWQIADKRYCQRHVITCIAPSSCYRLAV